MFVFCNANRSGELCFFQQSRTRSEACQLTCLLLNLRCLWISPMMGIKQEGTQKGMGGKFGVRKS